MDCFTHVLGPVLWTEPLSYSRLELPGYPVWRERMAVLLAALLPDADGVIGLPDVLGLTNGDWFARYHRIVTHSLGGLIVAALLAAIISGAWPKRWIFSFMRPKGETGDGENIAPVRLSFVRLFAFGLVGVFWHFVGDAITAWGTLKLLWPFHDMDFQLMRVNSLEPVLLTLTVAAWAIQHWLLNRGSRRGAWGAAVAWLVIGALYVWLRPMFGERAFV